MIVNKKADECLEQAAEFVEGAFQTRPCNEGLNRQMFTVSPYLYDHSKKTYIIQVRDPNTYMTTIHQKVLAAGDKAGLANVGRDGYFHFYDKNESQQPDASILKKGPFKVSGQWEHWRRLHVDDQNGIPAEVLKHEANASSGDNHDRQLFLDWDLWKQCKPRGIAFDDCTADILKDCNLPNNKNVFSVCPKEYCTNPSNVMKPECRQWCDSNPGVCDQAAETYCNTDAGKADPSCSCFGAMPETNYTRKLEEQGIVLKKSCNYTPCVVGNGYKTQPMLLQQCPSINACISGVDIGTIEGNADISRINNTCTINATTTTTPGANIGTGAGTGTGTGAAAATPPSDDEEDSEDQETITGLPKSLFIILVVIGIIFLIIILALLAR